MKRVLLLLALLLAAPAAAQAPARIAAERTPAGIVVSWERPPETWACLKFTGINPDQFIGRCEPRGSLILDAGLAQYAGRGRMVGLWGSSSDWIAGPVSLPGWRVVLPIVAKE